MAKTLVVNTSNTPYFKFKVPGESTWSIPVAPIEGTDRLNLSSNWTTTNIPGSTEAVSAFNYVNNPTLPIQLKFHEDMLRDAGVSYNDTINKLASLQYPGGSTNITPPYVFIYYNGNTYRGYFTSMSISRSGPFRNGYQVVCEINAQFTLVKSKSPTKSGIASSLPTTFQ